jgi:hypothetical protein
LKKSAGSDKVAIVDSHNRLFARQLHIPPAREKPGLSLDDEQLLDHILAEWDTQGPGCARKFREIIGLALRRLKWDLDTGSKDEVIEDLQREIAYRLWCARTG